VRDERGMAEKQKIDDGGWSMSLLKGFTWQEIGAMLNGMIEKAGYFCPSTPK